LSKENAKKLRRRAELLTARARSSGQRRVEVQVDHGMMNRRYSTGSRERASVRPNTPTLFRKGLPDPKFSQRNPETIEIVRGESFRNAFRKLGAIQTP